MVLPVHLSRPRHPRGVPVSGTIRIGHNAAAAILNTIIQHDSDAVVVGWKGRRTHRRDAVLGSNVDRIVTEAGGDVFVEKIGMDADGVVDPILLPTAGGPHAALAIETAAAIAGETGATLHPVYVRAPGASEEAREYAQEMLDTARDSVPGVDCETILLEDDDVVGALVAESANHDLTIIGATREGVFQKFLFGTIPETVAERAGSTVIMTKRSLDVGTRLQQSVDKLQERATGRVNPLEEDDIDPPS
ncbi:universal stress protein [Halorarius litoreus]|uniref:universal stress protein n=1 Tax=Halorarius litoreus TaxID=2962676 RepID=UPI0020CCF50F|nr:universal stress protein [Halorarius litoreus]